jgi:hypothetical protein
MLDITIAIPVLVALVEAIKRASNLDSKYAAILSVALGALGFALLADGEMTARIFEGVVAGLSASGLYSGAKATVR